MAISSPRDLTALGTAEREACARVALQEARRAAPLCRYLIDDIGRQRQRTTAFSEFTELPLLPTAAFGRWRRKAALRRNARLSIVRFGRTLGTAALGHKRPQGPALIIGHSTPTRAAVLFAGWRLVMRYGLRAGNAHRGVPARAALSRRRQFRVLTESVRADC
jgi:hypothetical protein